MVETQQHKTESKAHEYKIREKSKQEREEYVRGSAQEKSRV